MFSGARSDSKEVIKHAYPTTFGGLATLNYSMYSRPGLIDSKLHAMMTQTIMPVAMENGTPKLNMSKDTTKPQK